MHSDARLLAEHSKGAAVVYSNDEDRCEDDDDDADETRRQLLAWRCRMAGGGATDSTDRLIGKNDDARQGHVGSSRA
jgi:hypothetical protein